MGSSCRAHVDVSASAPQGNVYRHVPVEAILTRLHYPSEYIVIVSLFS